MLDSLVCVSRWVAWNHMTLNNLGTVCVLFPSTACLSSSTLRARSKSNWEGRGQPKRAWVETPLLDLSLHTISYNTSWNQLPFCRAYHSASTAVDTHCWEIWQFWSEDIQRRSIRIRTVHVTKQNCLNLSNALLIPWASLQTVSRSINFHFKVLFIFPWQYLFSIGLVPIFSFRRSLPPILDCISKQPNWLGHNVRHTRLSPSSICRPKQLKHSASSLKALLEATIRCCKQQRF